MPRICQIPRSTNPPWYSTLTRMYSTKFPSIGPKLDSQTIQMSQLRECTSLFLRFFTCRGTFIRSAFDCKLTVPWAAQCQFRLKLFSEVGRWSTSNSIVEIYFFWRMRKLKTLHRLLCKSQILIVQQHCLKSRNLKFLLRLYDQAT